MPFFISFFQCFPATLRCSDCVYGEINIVLTKLIPNPVSIFLLEKNSFEPNLFEPPVLEVSNLAFLGCISGSTSVTQSISNFAPDLNTFTLSNLDETCYIDSFWDGICSVCIFLP